MDKFITYLRQPQYLYSTHAQNIILRTLSPFIEKADNDYIEQYVDQRFGFYETTEETNIDQVTYKTLDSLTAFELQIFSSLNPVEIKEEFEQAIRRLITQKCNQYIDKKPDSMGHKP